VTGKLLFQRSGEDWPINLGNVRMHKFAPNVERTKTAVARKGYVQVVEERPSQIEHRWTVGLDEELPELVRLHLLAGAGSAADQTAVTAAATYTANDVKKGQTIIVGQDLTAETPVEGLFDITVASVSQGATVLEEGVDYTVDGGAGTVTLLQGATITGEAADLTISYTCKAASFTKHTALSELVVKGTAYFDEFDQHSEVTRARYTFPAQIILTNGGDNDGKKLSEFEVDLLATGLIVRKGRVDA
jgi:hypothetical protein